MKLIERLDPEDRAWKLRLVTVAFCAFIVPYTIAEAALGLIGLQPNSAILEAVYNWQGAIRNRHYEQFEGSATVEKR